MARDTDRPSSSSQDKPVISRRTFLGAGVALGATGVALRASQAKLIEAAQAVSPPSKPSLSDIEHIVILMQENRSFDHYFGVLSHVRGFSDPNVLTQTVGGATYPIWDQFGYEPGVGPSPSHYLQPFPLLNNPPKQDGETTNDITHNWGPQHQSWNSGAMDDFLRAHLAADGPENGPLTMGHFNQDTLAFYYALADAFTICDAYHCSVLGPTDPNRLYWISATLDPEGSRGGPVLETYVTSRPEHYGSLTWETMPQRLSEAGISWKIYQDPSSLAVLDPIPYFKAFFEPSTPAEVAMASQATTPIYPATFVADVEAGTLPAVSWIIPDLAQCEHPAAPPEYGENLVQTILNTLVSNPDIWAHTVFFVMHDENGGFFDHVPPPTPPEGTEGEWLTVNPLPAAASGIRGPIGLGFRVPCLVISPFSRGGYLCSETFDHTSLLRFIETRFGVEVPNLTRWRRSVTGDLTSALALARPADYSVPSLPATFMGDPTIAQEAVVNALLGTDSYGQIYPVPSSNSMPTQLTSPPRPPVPSSRSMESSSAGKRAPARR